MKSEDPRAPACPTASRRDVVTRGAAVLVGVSIAGSVLRPRRAEAAKALQSVAMYQPEPHGQQECDRCVHFIPGKTPTAPGTCQVVAGSISPHGWCVLFGPKA